MKSAQVAARQGGRYLLPEVRHQPPLRIDRVRISADERARI
jgi:hypothetical protein